MWTVTRQRQWPDGGTVVEISSGGLDYANPDALAGKYPGEFEEFGDPRAAVEAAIGIAEAWKADAPDDDIQVATGATGGYTMPFDGEELTEETKRGLRGWAEGVWGKLPDCGKCGDKITGKPVTLVDYDEEFCSENCAERWHEGQQVWDEPDEEFGDELTLGLKSSSQGGTPMRYKCRACGRVTNKPYDDPTSAAYKPTCEDLCCGATCDPVTEDTEGANTDATEGTPRASGAYHRIVRALEAAPPRRGKAAPDARVENLGSVRILQPLSPAGWAWARENLAVESWQMTGGGIAIEPRMVQGIVDGMEAAGLTVDTGTRASKASPRRGRAAMPAGSPASQSGDALDAKVENLGSICILQPLSSAGKAWTDENLAVESWQMTGGGIAIEPRMVQDIIDGMEAAGLTVDSQA
jgi:hypothetical protein